MSSTLDLKQLATEIMNAYATRTLTPSPSSRDAAFNMADAYAVESELVRRRQAAGRTTTGLKVGYANKAMWRALKLETLVWAHMYDDTVVFSSGEASLSIERMVAPKIEPEIVFKVREPIAGADPAAILAGVEWVAPGFEIIDCVFPDWQFQPVDFVAAYGLHAALVIGQPRPVTAEIIPTLAEQLPKFKLVLSRNGDLVEEGSGKNSLRSPALCLGELARVSSLRPGDLVSSGTLTTPTPIAKGEEWKASLEGLDLPNLTLRLTV
ncbi:MAG TPA: fumarylacetoacetate hydrolase family protein [Terriglobia bacterium]|nr:fumarylacetoacetate hydrolase family protein [Terriglobia bacterium]